MDTHNKLNLSFSGGGFRATFYSMGAYRRLGELGLHNRISAISSVSGGSIAAGAIMTALATRSFSSVQDFDVRVYAPLRRLAQRNLRQRIVVKAAMSGTWDLPRSIYSRLLPSILNEELFGGTLFMDLPVSPEWSCNATCLNTMKRFRFKPTDIQDTSIGTSQDIDDITVGHAVAASAAFPLMFAPVELDISRREFVDRFGNAVYAAGQIPSKLYLTDGGVYDNLGSEKMIASKEPYLILDASAESSAWEYDFHPRYFRLNQRTLETALNQIVMLRRRLIYNTQTTYGMQLRLGIPVGKIPSEKFAESYKHIDLSKYQNFDPRIERLIATIRTDLDGFHDVEIECLAWAGAIRTDLAVKALIPDLVPTSEWDAVPQMPDYNTDKMIKTLATGKKRRLLFTHRSLHA